MNLFADYIQPLTHWLQVNPNWSLFITFIVALSESLAIVGSIIPGSVTMTAIGILAGSGIMRIDLTLLASTLGAVCGDSLSYALGYIYSDRLSQMWPFKKYPNWLMYGKDYFSRHGGKSVLIGRFVGPLRSIIPMIAGMMHMKQWRFLIANIISALGWSVLYVMPGVLIGTAGHELSAEGATRLFIIILIMLLMIWLTSLVIKWLVIKLHLFLKNNLHDFWLRLKTSTYLYRIYDLLTPKDEPNHYPTAGLVLLTLCCILSSIGLTLLVLQGSYIEPINIAIHLFFQSVYTYVLQVIFIGCTQLTSTITISTLYICFCLWFIYTKNLKNIMYCSLLVCTSVTLGCILSHFITSPRPQGLLMVMTGNSFPNIHLLVASALYGFFFYYINNRFLLLTSMFRSTLLVALGLSGLGSLYLGDNWFSDVFSAYFLGASICLIFCIFFRKFNASPSQKTQSVLKLIIILSTLLLSSALSLYLNFRVQVYAHTPYEKKYTIEQSTWWNQQKPLLPLYRFNRVGKRATLMNIQYSGHLNVLQNSLEQSGWNTHNESFFKKILIHISANKKLIMLPLLSQLYENKRPVLTMSYKDEGSGLVLELRLWESSYSFKNLSHPLWIGTLHSNPNTVFKPENNAHDMDYSLSYMLPALERFTLRRISLPNHLIKKTLLKNDPYILLINRE